MGKLASGLSSIYSRYFLFGVLFVLAFVTALIETAAGLKILKHEYLEMISKSQPSAGGFIDLAGKASHDRLEIMLKF